VGSFEGSSMTIEFFMSASLMWQFSKSTWILRKGQTQSIRIIRIDKVPNINYENVICAKLQDQFVSLDEIQYDTFAQSLDKSFDFLSLSLLPPSPSFFFYLG
jgi:hypothetical protein